MNYKKIYDNIIINSVFKNRVKYKGVYYENHHIIPKCVGGSNDKVNLVLLTAKEHFICHKLLVEIYPNSFGLKYSAFSMTKRTLKQRNYIVSSREHDRIKNEYINSIHPISDDTKQKISNTLKILYSNSCNHPQYGTHRSIYTKNKLSIKVSNYFSIKENRDKQSISLGGKLFDIYEVDMLPENNINNNIIKYNIINTIGSYYNETFACEDLKYTKICRSTLHRRLTDGKLYKNKYIFKYRN